ncbi:hypothetical protein AK830_g5496 [Neonectria ditissima]|uniref:Uncharacterized protein n=1 Tax=Neonectria ditissima TaxID=78410 RepID=A0A0P7AT95_9HYPO|nr:hypothetical protein AK830_g5496 [Neonectria ditissima]
MGHQNSSSFSSDYGSFFSETLNPPIPTEPFPSNAMQTAGQPPCDGTCNLADLDGQSVNGPSAQPDHTEQTHQSQPEQIYQSQPGQVDPEIYELAMANTIFDNANFLPTVDPYSEFDFHLSVDDDRLGVGLEMENAVKEIQTQLDPLDESSIPARLLALEEYKAEAERKINDLLNWKAMQITRSLEMKTMMDEILEILHKHETKLNQEPQSGMSPPRIVSV